MSEIGENGSEVSESAEVNETPPAETGGESSEATQEAATEEANESGGFDDFDNTEAPDDNNDDYEEMETDEETDDSQDVGFDDGDDVDNKGARSETTEPDHGDDLPTSDEDRVGFDDSDTDDKFDDDTENFSNVDTSDEEASATENSTDEGEDRALDDFSEDDNEAAEDDSVYDLDEQAFEDEDLGELEEYDEFDTPESDPDNSEVDNNPDENSDGNPDNGDNIDDGQDVDDDGDDHSEDPEADPDGSHADDLDDGPDEDPDDDPDNNDGIGDNQDVDSDGDAHSEDSEVDPNGSDADNLDDSPDEDLDGNLDNDGNVDDNQDVGDDGDAHSEDSEVDPDGSDADNLDDSPDEDPDGNLDNDGNVDHNQEVGDDGDAHSEDSEADPDGSDADDLDDGLDEDSDGDLDSDDGIDDDSDDNLDIDDDFNNEAEDEDPGEIEQYPEDEPEKNKDEADSDDETKRDEDNEERAIEEENQEAADQAETEAIEEDADSIIQDEANPIDDNNRKVTEEEPETESEDVEHENDGDASTLEPSPEETAETEGTQQDMDDPDPIDDELDDVEGYRDEGEAENYEEDEKPTANAELVTQESSAGEASVEKDTVADEVSKSSESHENDDAYRSAINNMSEYMNAHNYGPDNYAEYSKDPEWQKLNADLQRSMGMEVNPETPDTAPPSTESGKDVSASELPDHCVIVNACDIDMTDAQGMDSDQFWNHHGNTKEDYMRVAEKIPDVQQAMDSGKSLDEIKQDPELRDTVCAYYDPNNMIKVEQQPDGSYSFIDDGRHRIAAAQEYGYQIPVEVENMPENANALKDGNTDVNPGSESQPETQSPEQPQPEEIEKKAEISNDIRKCLEAFDQSNWDNLSQVEKEQAVEKLRDSIADDLQLEIKPNIAYYDNENPGDYGGYASSTNTIYINRFNMGDAAETADTIAHESRHCWQHERADHPQTGQDYLFKENFEDYVRPEDDYRAYKNQIVESDARDYAARVTKNIPDKSSSAYSDNGTVDKSVPEFDNESSRAPPEILDDNSKTLDTSELPADFESKENSGDYSTKIDGMVQEVEKEPLPDSIAQSFKDGEYRTAVTTEPITLYRVYGGGATVEGSYCTTEPCVDREKTRNDLALKPSWGNTIEKEAEIVIPAGTKLNIGRVAEQSEDGKILNGNADQILLPQNWDKNWVKKARDID